MNYFSSYRFVWPHGLVATNKDTWRKFHKKGSSVIVRDQPTWPNGRRSKLADMPPGQPKSQIES